MRRKHTHGSTRRQREQAAASVRLWHLAYINEAAEEGAEHAVDLVRERDDLLEQGTLLHHRAGADVGHRSAGLREQNRENKLQAAVLIEIPNNIQFFFGNRNGSEIGRADAPGRLGFWFRWRVSGAHDGTIASSELEPAFTLRHLPTQVAEGLYATDKDVESFRRKAKVWLQNPLLDCVPGGLRPAPILHRLTPTVCAVQILGGGALSAAVLGAVTLTVAKR